MAKASKNKPQKGNKGNKGNKGKKDTKKVKPSSAVSTRTRVKQNKKPVPSHIDLSKEGKEFRHVVRISGRDIPGYLPIGQGLDSINGISPRIGRILQKIFIKVLNKDVKKVGYLTDVDAQKLDEVIENLDKHLPSYLLNRSKTIDGKSKHMIMADLQLENRKDIQRLGKTKSYRGLRLQWGLPVRGQKTKSTFRRTGAVGVSKKKN